VRCFKCEALGVLIRYQRECARWKGGVGVGGWRFVQVQLVYGGTVGTVWSTLQYRYVALSRSMSGVMRSPILGDGRQRGDGAKTTQVSNSRCLRTKDGTKTTSAYKSLENCLIASNHRVITVRRRCTVISLCVGVWEKMCHRCAFVCHFRVLFVCLSVTPHFFESPYAICVEGYLRG
jgi:hypothetical protein